MRMSRGEHPRYLDRALETLNDASRRHEAPGLPYSNSSPRLRRSLRFREARCGFRHSTEEPASPAEAISSSVRCRQTFFRCARVRSLLLASALSCAAAALEATLARARKTSKDIMASLVVALGAA